MNEYSDPKHSRKCHWSSWSFLRKAQVAGGLISALITFAILVFDPWKYSNIMSYSSLIILIITEPTILIVKPFGISPHWFINDQTGDWAAFPLCLIIKFNAFLGFLIGTIADQIRTRIKTKGG